MKRDYYYNIKCHNKIDTFIYQGKLKLAKKYYNKMWRLIRLDIKRGCGTIVDEDLIDFMNRKEYWDFEISYPNFETYLTYYKEIINGLYKM